MRSQDIPHDVKSSFMKKKKIIHIYNLTLYILKNKYFLLSCSCPLWHLILCCHLRDTFAFIFPLGNSSIYFLPTLLLYFSPWSTTYDKSLICNLIYTIATAPNLSFPLLRKSGHENLVKNRTYLLRTSNWRVEKDLPDNHFHRIHPKTKSFLWSNSEWYTPILVCYFRAYLLPIASWGISHNVNVHLFTWEKKKKIKNSKQNNHISINNQ